MDTGALLLRAVLEQPADNTARLVYADWLEEHDEEAWAQFIRICVNCGHENGCTLQPHVYYDRCWWVKRVVKFDPFVPELKPEEYLYRRGFVDEIRMGAASFTEELARELFSRHPVTAVRLVDKEPLRWWEGEPVEITGDPPGERWSFYADTNGIGGPESARLSLPLFRKVRELGTMNRKGAWFVDFPTRPVALVALRLGAVAWGRELAGLSSLPESCPSLATGQSQMDDSKF